MGTLGSDVTESPVEDTVCPSSLTSLQGLGEPFPFSQAAVPCQAEAKAGRSGVGRAPGLGLHSRGYPEQEALPGQGWIATPGFIQCPSTHPQPAARVQGGWKVDKVGAWVSGSLQATDGTCQGFIAENTRKGPRAECGQV